MELQQFMGKYLITEGERIVNSTFSWEETKKFLKLSQGKTMKVFRWNETVETKLCKKVGITMEEGYQLVERR